MQINVADAAILSRILRRKRKSRETEHEVDLSAVLREILKRANEFVPSESGSILLDDPLLKWDPEKAGKLYFLACFGRGSSTLAGTSLSDTLGIVGETYQSGRPYISQDVLKDTKYYPRLDQKLKARARSIICSPITIDDSIVGVIELINRKGRITYDRKDLALLEIFAGYTATLIKNALDARRFEDLSKKDNLTGLFNDRYLFQRLLTETRKALKTKRDMTLIFFDLDHFKDVNDTNGHLAGSRVLKEIAAIMEEVFLSTDAVLARYGGDEYVVLMPRTNIRQAVKYAERLRAGIEGFTFLKNRGPYGELPLNIKGIITCSIGVASLFDNVRLVKNDGKVIEYFIKAADTAMYQAKEGGKNRVCIAEGRI